MTKKRKRKPHRRRDYVVNRVLACAIAELGAAGYGAFRVENVARAADVNKTTIYRRWPEKRELVEAALEAIPPAPSLPEPAESLRDELVQLSEQFAEWVSSDGGRAVLGFAEFGAEDPKLHKLAQGIRATYRRRLKSRLQQAAEKKQFRKNVDPELFLDAWLGCLRPRAGVRSGRIDARTVRAVVDFLLAGAEA